MITAEIDASSCSWPAVGIARVRAARPVITPATDGAEAADQEHRHHDAVDRDAEPPRRLAVAADEVDPAAPSEASARGSPRAGEPATTMIATGIPATSLPPIVVTMPGMPASAGRRTAAARGRSPR
jgi:hypothetical protein